MSTRKVAQRQIFKLQIGIITHTVFLEKSVHGQNTLGQLRDESDE